MESSQIARVRFVNQILHSASPFPAAALAGAEIDAGPRIENVSGNDHDLVVKDWLKQALCVSAPLRLCVKLFLLNSDFQTSWLVA